MKLWKIGLYIVCILIILCYIFYRVHEGFQEVPDPISVLNVSYADKYVEAYLVLPNVPNTTGYTSPYSDTLRSDGSLAPNISSRTGQDKTYYDGAFSMADAEAICLSLDARLATKEEFQTAALLGGFWGVASWASDGNKYAIIPEFAEPSFINTNMTSNSEASRIPSITGVDTLTHYPLKKIISPSVTKAFPVCWGVKPSEGTVLRSEGTVLTLPGGTVLTSPGGSLGIQSFNEGDNSMYTPTVLGAVMNPSSTELLPVEFTIDQAIYALQRTNYSTTDARKYLIDSLDGSAAVNNKIYQEAVGLSQYNEDGSNKRLNPCTILQNTYNKFYDQYKNVHDILRDISGGVIDMGRAKDENVRFQMKIASVCQIETATTSPACLKLATLDYDLLYSTTGGDLSTSRLAKLEMLNYTLFARSQELCMAMDSLFDVHKLLLCPSFAGSLPRCQWNSLGSGSDSGSAYMLKELEPNGEPYLRLKLKQISPYFSVSGYAYLTAAVDELASTLDIPTLNDFQTSDQRFAAVSNGIETIKSFMTSGA